MSFRSLLIQKIIRPETNAFRIGVEKRGVVLKLPQDASQRLRWEAGTKVDVQIGEDADAGKVRLCRDDKIGKSLIKAGSESKGLRVVLRRELFPDAPETLAAETVKYELDGKTAIVAVLPWVEQASAGKAEGGAPNSGTAATAAQGGEQCDPSRSRVAAPGRDDRRSSHEGEAVTSDEGGVADDATAAKIEQDAAPQAHQASLTADDASSGGNSGVVTDPPVTAGWEGHQKDAPGAFARESAEAEPAFQPSVSGAGTDTAAAPFSEAGGDPDVAGNAIGQPAQRPPSFPVQEKSLAEIEQANPPAPRKPASQQFASKPGAHPSSWSELKKRLFIEAVLDGKGDSVLAKIAERPVGSIWNIRNHVLKAEIDAARVARRAASAPQAFADRSTAQAVPPPFKVGPLPPAPTSPSRSAEEPRVAPRYAPVESAEPKPTLSPELLKFLRDECAPVLLPLGIKVTKNGDDTGLLRNGKPVTLDDVVAEVNRIVGADDPDFEPIKFEAAA